MFDLSRRSLGEGGCLYSFAWFALFDAKKVTRRFIPVAPGGGLTYNFNGMWK